MLAEVSSDVDLYEYLGQAVLILFVVGGIALVLCNLVLGGGSVSSISSRSRKYGPLQDSLDIGSDAKEQQSPTTGTLLRRVTTGKGRERRTSVRRRGNPVGVVVLAGEAAKAEPGLVINRS